MELSSSFIFFMSLPQGSTIKVLVSLFNIKLEETEDPTLAEEMAATTVDHITAGVEEIIGYRGTNFFKVGKMGKGMGRRGQRQKQEVKLKQYCPMESD